jgi:mutator protein MutT
VLNDNNEILLIKYSAGKYQGKKLAGKYALPGGKVRFGETLDDSLVREVEEETSIICKPGIPVYCWSWEYQKENNRIQINAIARVCRYISGSLSQLKEETETSIEGSYWIAKENVLGLNIVDDEIPALNLLLDSYNFYLRSLR